MTADSAAPAAGTAPRSPFPRVRWRFERTHTGATLIIWAPPDDEHPEVRPVQFPMREEEAWMLIHGADRVMAWAASSVEGTFSSGPAPDQAAAQLAINRYLVTSKDIESHTRMAQATPWANWVEQIPKLRSQEGITWLVDVFAVDDTQFLQAALAHGIVVGPAPADG